MLESKGKAALYVKVSTYHQIDKNSLPLVVWKIDRISRNLLDFNVMYHDEIKDYNVTLVSKNEQFDTSSLPTC